MGRAAFQGGDRIDDRLLALLAQHAAAGTPCVLATVVRCEAPTSAHPGDAAVVDVDGHLTGWIGGSCSEPLVRREALRALADGLPRLVRIAPSETVDEVRTPGELTVATTCPSGGALDIFVDPQIPRPLLVVAGDSPAAHALVRIGAASGFRTCALHPGAQPADFPEADAVLATFDLGPARPHHDTWVVVATMGHYDEDALAAALAVPGADVALVASTRRAAAVLAGLRQRGLDAETVARVRIPAGGRRAGRQEQIALLALAEVVALREERLRGQAALTVADPGTSRVVAAEAERFATDPVCGMVVDVGTGAPSLVHSGRTIHFCCTGCRDRFAAAPEAFPLATA